MTKKKKSTKKKSTPAKKVIGDVAQNASPVCYADSKDLREEYIEKKIN